MMDSLEGKKIQSAEDDTGSEPKDDSMAIVASQDPQPGHLAHDRGAPLRAGVPSDSTARILTFSILYRHSKGTWR